ncbi:MAG: secretion system protein E [Methanomicrobiales archaeon HGW-Methanomicrobiales-1]|jgi:flagellar protein FlaI|nr:MAG: secretion system protein E [Methanomicrobiales archaeon HGW-Methanomicrobiales-1]
MSGLNKDTDEILDDNNSLLKMIGGIKKKEEQPEEPPRLPDTEPAPSSAPVGKGAAEPGDFSELLKKLGMEKNKSSSASQEPPAPAAPEQPDEVPAFDFDDLLEDIPQPPETPAPSSPVLESASSRSSPEKEPVSPAEQEEEPFVEIINEDPKAALRKNPARKVTPSPSPAASKETEYDEKIISVDQITDFSGLILPKGATFRVDEINLHGRINSFESTGTSALPQEFAEIWKREFSTAGFKDLDINGEIEIAREKIRAEPKKFSFSSLFKAIISEQEAYDPKIHGPLVDLSFQPKTGIEEMEMYPVNEPFAYIRITYDHSTHEYTYNVLEPILTDAEKDLLVELKERLFDTLDINTKDITKEEARRKLRVSADDIISDFGIKLAPEQREKIHYNMYKDFLGDGLIDPIMHDKYIEDISCDGVNVSLFAFHASYESMKTTLSYSNASELDSFVTKLAQRAGKYISIAEPILDATMQDGSRIQMTLGQEVTAHGSTFTIRKFKDEPITPTDLIEWRTFSPLAIAYIWLCVENGKSAIFAGGTASGKTTALNAISLFIPPMSKIVTLEDTREVKLPHPNWIPSVTRDSFDSAGRGEINMYELLRAAMRQRPEYIIVGEVRGKECQTLFQAMSTGHITYSTTHADSVASVVHRIENPPMDVPRNMLSALDFIAIQVQARVGGKRIRRNKQIVEILDIDPRTNELITNEVFKWRSATDEHSYSGKSYLLEEIMEAKGWDETRMREELKRRQEVLEWMRIKKIRHYKDVAKILISYHRDPEAVVEKVRKDLYE